MKYVYLGCFVISFGIFVYLFFTYIFEQIKKISNPKIEFSNDRKGVLLFAVIVILISIILNIIFALMICIILIYFKYLYYRKKNQDYIKSIDKQIIEAIIIFRNVILSGQSLIQAIDTVSKQIKKPLSDEFKRIYDKVGLGISLDEALKESSLNIQSEQYKLFVDAVRISNTTGAKLSDILDKIEKSISQRLVIYAKVEALTSQGKMSGNIVSIVPLFIVLFVYFVEPDMMGVLFTTFAGNIILFLSILMMLLGSFFIRKISEIDI